MPNFRHLRVSFNDELDIPYTKSVCKFTSSEFVVANCTSTVSSSSIYSKEKAGYMEHPKTSG